jgi:hypothetical protein
LASCDTRRWGTAAAKQQKSKQWNQEPFNPNHTYTSEADQRIMNRFSRKYSLILGPTFPWVLSMSDIGILQQPLMLGPSNPSPYIHPYGTTALIPSYFL